MKDIINYKWFCISTFIFFALIILLVLTMKFDKFGSTVVVAYGTVSKETVEVSLINLIATPEKYDGKLVRVVGVGNINFESNGLYLSKEDYKKCVTKNAVWLDIDEGKLSTTYANLKQSNGKYILIEGVFDSKKMGHFDRYSGTVENITRYEFWK